MMKRQQRLAQKKPRQEMHKKSGFAVVQYEIYHIFSNYAPICHDAFFLCRSDRDVIKMQANSVT